jgi:DNA/RNA endonuclease G (NUC1)
MRDPGETSRVKRSAQALLAVFATLIAGAAVVAALGAHGNSVPRIDRYGLPDTGMIAVRAGYIRSYDGRTRSARWVLERLTGDDFVDTLPRVDEFRVATDVPSEQRATVADYTNATTLEGDVVDRGHLAPASHHKRDRQAQSDTYLLDVIVPQAAQSNRIGAYPALERAIQRLAQQEDVREVYVLTAPIYWPEDDADTVTYRVIGRSRIPVPTHIGKSVLAVRTGGRLTIWSFVCPNRATSLTVEECQVTTDEFERRSGLDVWPALAPDVANRLESATPEMW